MSWTAYVDQRVATNGKTFSVTINVSSAVVRKLASCRRSFSSTKR